MKPNFALTLSFEGIGLLHRAFPGWHLVGDVPLHTDDLTGDLAILRNMAGALDPSGVRTKLVLPNDQIKYLHIPITVDETPDVVAREALTGATPYAVDDLAYDFKVVGDKIHIAAVAKETLAEAEEFSIDHDFNPISFVGMPEEGEFPGEPFFGATTKVLSEGITDADIARDSAAVRIIGAAKLPEAAQSAEPVVTESPTPVEQPSFDNAEAEPATSGAATELESADVIQEEIAPGASEDTSNSDVTDPVDPETAPEENTPPSEPDLPSEEPDDTEPTVSVLADTLPSEQETDATQPETADEQDNAGADPVVAMAEAEESSLAESDAEVPETSTDASENEDAPLAEVAPKPNTDMSSSEEDVTNNDDGKDADAEKDTPAPVPGFASIRATRDDAGAVPPRFEGVSRDDAPPRLNLTPATDVPVADSAASITGISDAALPEDDVPSTNIRPNINDRLVAPAPDADTVEYAPLPDLDLTSEPEPTPLAAPAEDYRAEPEPASSLSLVPSFFTRRSRTKAAPAFINDIPEPADERQRMTVFGARDSAAVRGKPRFLGLILTAALLLFLIGVAAWASIFMDDGIARFFREDDTQMVATLPDSETAETDDKDAIELASLGGQQTVPVLEDPATEILSRVTPQDLSPDEAKARYAATGIWQLSPEAPAEALPTELEDFYQTSLDPVPAFQDAVALPAVSSAFSDGMFFTPPLPPSPDTTFVIDSRGYVLATAVGALTPEGVAVFAGRPDVAMPAILRRANPQEQIESDTPDATPQVAALRPRARPADAAEQIERNGLSGRTLNELGAIRPKLRPESAQEAAELAQKTAEAEAARAQAEAEAAAAAQASTVDLDALQSAVAEAVEQQPDAFAGATSQAVRASLKPNTRPRNFDSIVKRTKRNQERQQAQQQSAEEAQPVRVAAAQKVTPKIPTATSVSKAATERNALKFKRVNLIGVYGTPANRRALVRMSNGRYKKVKVGDRLDGGKVRAIGDAELRYQKGGRNVVLKMPRG